MRRTLLAFTLAAGTLLAGCTTTDTGTATTETAAPLAAAEPVPVSQLVEAVHIPYEAFTLDNGLRVIVHEDHKAPVVAVSVWYHVGSKDEPKGKTGFAHLFEHLMFNGSENAPGDFFEPLQQVGATDYNGTTWFDRTNYFETVPTPALERALFLESDRMGHLLGAVTQENLTNQIGVVQNEKRQGDNQPYGLVEYAQLEALFPEGHPYRHSTIGSMEDLTNASLDDVKSWFRQNYGPNNAVLVLAGDVDLETARRLVTKYFGDIPRGPEVTPAAASVPTLPAPKSEVMHDRVAATRLYRLWAVPGLTHEDTVPLDVGAAVLGGLASSRLDNILVRDEQTAVAVTASLQPFERVSLFEVTADVKPGVDPAVVAQRLDQIIADLIANGPTADEVRRVATREVSGRIAGLESVGGFGGKAVALAEGALYANDPEFYKKQLLAYANATPETVKAALQEWLTRPVYALTVAPGEREAYDEAPGQSGTHHPAYYRQPTANERPLAPKPPAYVPVEAAAMQSAGAAAAGVDRSTMPAVGQVPDLEFPDIQRTTLSNGIEVVYAQRTATPTTRVSVTFNAGTAADPKDKLGTEALTRALLDEGTTTRNSIQIAEEQERLGAQIYATASSDQSSVGMYALTPNLAPSLALMSDIVRNPAFAPEEVERLRNEQLTRIQAELTSPSSIASRALGSVLYGAAHPYGGPGSGTTESVKSITRADLDAFHDTWMRPDNAQIFVVSDQPLAEIQPLLETAFGDWTAPATPKGVKNFDVPVPQVSASKIYLIDRPQSPQSVIIGAQLLPLQGTDQLEEESVANDVLGGSFLSRLNMDLRETKGWSYGVRGGIQRVLHTVPYLVSAPVQSNQTGPSIAALQSGIEAFLGPQGITQEEYQRTINGRTLSLAGQLETSSALLGALQSIELYNWPDNYYETLADRYRSFSIPELNQSLRQVIDPKEFIWVVVGDASVVRPQLEKLNIPVETMEPR